MKSVALISLMAALVGTAFAFSEPKPEPRSRGCMYITGECAREYEEGTSAYVSNCDYLMPEATCDKPYPQPAMTGRVCDFTACYCDFPTVSDPVTNKCVVIEDYSN